MYRIHKFLLTQSIRPRDMRNLLSYMSQSMRSYLRDKYDLLDLLTPREGNFIHLEHFWFKMPRPGGLQRKDSDWCQPPIDGTGATANSGLRSAAHFNLDFASRTRSRILCFLSHHPTRPVIVHRCTTSSTGDRTTCHAARVDMLLKHGRVCPCPLCSRYCAQPMTEVTADWHFELLSKEEEHCRRRGSH